MSKLKKIWILNHYATDMYLDKGGRHYWFAKELIKNGYEPIIICASFVHKGNDNYIEDKKDFIVKYSENIPFIFIRTKPYQGNGKARIKNMFEYFYRVLKSSNKIKKKFGKPDVIIGSSVHPLACVAGIILGKKYKCKKISEIRDLWPETLLMMEYVKENSLLSKVLYFGEKMIYKYSDSVIFTMEGGRQYIIDRGWDKEINLNKIYYINNGIDLEKYKELQKQSFYDEDLENNKFKLIYTGTIAKVNNMKIIVETAEKLQKYQNIQFLMYGDGEERKKLEEYCKEKKLKNIIFKGRVNKEKIPYVLTKANILVYNYNNMYTSKFDVLRYGISTNKLFDYLASGKLILQTFTTNFNPIKKYNCGIILEKNISSLEIAKKIVELQELPLSEYEKYFNNSMKAIEEFDFKNLTRKLIKVIEE